MCFEKILVAQGKNVYLIPSSLWGSGIGGFPGFLFETTIYHTMLLMQRKSN